VQFRDENSNGMWITARTGIAMCPAVRERRRFDPLEKVAAKRWPGIPVLPNMSTGASDGVYRSSGERPTYCVSGHAQY